MKKILITALSAVFVSLSFVPAYATASNTIAIIDTGFNADQYRSSVVEEVCVTAGLGCNNRKSFDIGIGAAGSKNTFRGRGLQDWNHGTEMVQNILSVYPDAKLVLIRNSKVYGSTVLPGAEADLEAALEWVYENSSKYNIVAVSFSRGSHKYVTQNKEVSRLMGTIKVYENMVARLKATNNKLAGTFEAKLNELKNQLETLGTIACPVKDSLRNTIIELQQDNVATIVATGNDADKRYADYPACIDEAVAVAASDNLGNLVYVSNVSANTDFVSEAPTTSEATARFAAKWLKFYAGSFSSTYNLMVAEGTKIHHHSAIFVP